MSGVDPGAHVQEFAARRDADVLRQRRERGTMADLPLVVPTQSANLSQEIHLSIQHAICDTIDAEVAE